MTSSQSGQPITEFAMERFRGRTKPAPTEPVQMPPVNTKNGDGGARPSTLKKRTLTPEPEPYKKRMRGPIRDLALEGAS